MIDRRTIIVSAAAGLGLWGAACGPNEPAHTAHDEKGESAKEEEEVSPVEDLMREHGALNRMLLLYEECGRRIDTGSPGPAVEVLAATADIVRRFIEDYHEKLEEEHLFPRFEKAGKMVDLVGTLRRQHDAGRRLTREVLRLATPASAADQAGRQSLVTAIHAFVRMYRPHEAREDTVLFPALRQIVPPKEWDALGERFEDKEHELFGKAGFEGIVDQVAALEKRVDIFDLDAFTPPAP